MIIVMNHAAPSSAIDRVIAEIEKMGNQAHLSRGQFRTVIGAVGEEGSLDQNHLASLDGVEKVVPILKPYKLASREFKNEDSVVEIWWREDADHQDRWDACGLYFRALCGGE